MPQCTPRRLAAALASAALTVAAGVGLVAAPAAAAPVTETFDEVGAHTFTVPPDVCALTVDAFGAQGGGLGGALGGHVATALAVTPDEDLEVVVGGAGEASPVGGAGDAGGFNGGGNGGGGVVNQGAGGGGATDLRRAPYGLADRLFVAGGGGGGTSAVVGGAGGGATGDAGGDDESGGGGATQMAGGAGGAGPNAGSAGTDGQGGDGGFGLFVGGGGGGGGLFGGGGGGGDAGGGGGGSGFTPDGTGMANGVREGDGLVTITYDADAGTCPEPRPDAQVRAVGGGFVGDDVYNADGAGQSVSTFALRLFAATYDVALENDGNVDDTFTVTGTGSARGFAVAYLDGGANVTSEVVAGTYATPTVAAGKTHTLQVRVTVEPLAPLLGSHAAVVTAASHADPARADTVRAVTSTL